MLLRGSNVSIQGGICAARARREESAVPEGTVPTSNAAIVDAGPYWGDGTYAKVHYEASRYFNSMRRSMTFWADSSGVSSAVLHTTSGELGGS